MTYSFVCPFPCNKELRVDALGNEEAINKLIIAGAIGCRNAQSRYNCEIKLPDMQTMPESKLREIVGSCMREEYDEQEDYTSIMASLNRSRFLEPTEMVK